jgi:hypothetical protein
MGRESWDIKANLSSASIRRNCAIGWPWPTVAERVSCGISARSIGEVDTTDAAMRKLIAKLAAKQRQLTFCYEAELC